MQQQVMQENQNVMELQQRIIEEQAAYLKTLLKKQDELKVRVQSLQADMSVLRYQRHDPSSSSFNSHANRHSSMTHQHHEDVAIGRFNKPSAVIEIGTRVRDLGDEEDDDDDNDNEEEAEKEAVERSQEGGCRDATLAKNRELKDLIHKTTQEMKDNTEGGASLMDKQVGCRPLSLPDDNYLFEGMMLSDEELRMQQLLSFQSATTDGSRENSETLKAREESFSGGQKDGNSKAVDDDEANVGCVNIEVTLLEESGENAVVDNEDEKGDLDKDETARAANATREDTPGKTQDEKKEMDHVELSSVSTEATNKHEEQAS
jgi:hypothetical protein